MPLLVVFIFQICINLNCFNLWKKRILFIICGLPGPHVLLYGMFICGSIQKTESLFPPIPAILEDLRHRIVETVPSISTDQLIRVCQKVEYRFDVCRTTHGARVSLRTLRVKIVPDSELQYFFHVQN